MLPCTTLVGPVTMVCAVRFVSASLAALRPAAAATPRLRLVWAPSLGSKDYFGKDNYYENFEYQNFYGCRSGTATRPPTA